MLWKIECKRLYKIYASHTIKEDWIQGNVPKRSSYSKFYYE